MVGGANTRTLRKLIADIARFSPADREAVLGALDADQREIVLENLRRYAGISAPSVKPASGSNDAPSIAAGLAAVFVQRLTPQDQLTDVVAWRMTPAALGALQDCASRLPAYQAPAAPSRTARKAWYDLRSSVRGAP